MRTQLVLLTLGALGAVGCSAAASPPAASPASTTLPPAARTITATGSGQAEGTPDLLTVSLGVQSSGASAQATLASNNTEAQAVIAKLEADGVAAKDIQTTQLSVNPQFGDNGRQVTGYQASDIVTVKIRQLGQAGRIIDDAAAASGQDARIDGLSYSVQDPGPLEAAARADGVAQATTEAKAMAGAAGVTLGRVVQVTDASSPQVMPYAPSYSAAAGSVGAPPVPVQAGSEDVTAQVTVVFAVS